MYIARAELKEKLMASLLTAKRLLLSLVLISAVAGSAWYYVTKPADITIKARPVATLKEDFSRSDLALYEATFKAQERGDIEAADGYLNQVENPVLLGHVLAERYLGTHYTASADDLRLWLSNFSDLPQAERIAALAQRKGATSVSRDAFDTAMLKGAGYTEHLGASSPPRGWYQGLSEWRKKSYGSAASSFSAVANNTEVNGWHRAAAAYWAARAFSRMGDNRSAARALELAKQFPLTLYGQLASVRMGEEPAIVTAAPYVPSTLRASPAVMRAKALVGAGQSALAEDELRAVFSMLSARDKRGLVTIAAELGLANLQIRLTRTEGLTDDEKDFAAYPIPRSVVEATSSINPALILAIARQESGFRAEVKSPAGASGLMQIMPATAAHIKRQPGFGVAIADARFGAGEAARALDLMHPELSVKMGSKYLRMLMAERHIKGSLVHILAAYNAGPGSVATWVRAAGRVDDPLLFMESIPYPETRNYVVQVLSHYIVYKNMLGMPTPELQAMASGQWPAYHY
jgi:soluble lytic murein transglycosylase